VAGLGGAAREGIALAIAPVHEPGADRVLTGIAGGQVGPCRAEPPGALAAPVTLSVGATLATVTVKLRSATLWPSETWTVKEWLASPSRAVKLKCPVESSDAPAPVRLKLSESPSTSVATSGNDSV
jgi:hypothetical protein